MSAQHTPGLALSIVEAREIAGVLRKEASSLRDEAVGKIHNAKLGRLADAEKSDALADRVDAWADEQQHAQNERNSAGVRKFMKARAKATGSAS